MESINLTPKTSLSLEDIQAMTIHSTRSSIRRAGAVKQMICVPASEKVPTLYYINEGVDETGEATWSIHALSVDVDKFLLTQVAVADSSSSTTDEDPVEE